MKKLILIAMMASGLVACAQSTAPQEDSRLKEAYSACINTAQGSPEKIEACQSVLNVLKKEKQHQQFAEQESVRVLNSLLIIQYADTFISSLPSRKVSAYWIISSVFRQRKPEMIRR